MTALGGEKKCPVPGSVLRKWVMDEARRVCDRIPFLKKKNWGWEVQKCGVNTCFK